MSEQSEARSRIQLPALDGLRGIAVLLVMVHNLTVLDVRASLGAKLYVFVTDAGWIGVLLFFVLSGFLITGILLDDRGAPHYFRNFYVRRVLRIFPLYYLTLVVRLVVVPLVDPATAVPIDDAVLFLFFASNWSPVANDVSGLAQFWSLAVEEQFYLVWPLIAHRLGARGLAWACAVIILASIVSRAVVHFAELDPRYLYLSTVTRADAIAFGALVAIALRSDRWRPWLARYHLAIGGAAVVALGVVAARAHGLSRYNGGIELVGYSMLAIGFAALVAHIALDPERRRPRWACFAPLRAAGRYSYAAYVVHAPIKVTVLYFAAARVTALGVHDHWERDAVWVAGLMVASFVVAMISWVALERPLLKLKDRWAPR